MIKRESIMVFLLLGFVLVFLAGCAQKQPEDQNPEMQNNLQTTEDTSTSYQQTKTYSVNEPQQQESTAQEQSQTETRTVQTDSGDEVTLQKKEMYIREKEQSEHCDLDFPLNCAKYFAKDGIVYVTIKNGYVGKMDDVTLLFSGQTCDPSGSFIEPGVRKEYECYVSSDLDVVQGDLEVEYYSVIEQRHTIKTGSLAVKME